jgi:steroid delta-isomerase
MERAIMRLTREQLLQHAKDWIAAWNAADLDAILAPYAEDCVFISPRAVAITGSPRIAGKPALRAYWQAALDRADSLRFELLDVVCDEPGQALLVHYISNRDGVSTRACELMRFSDGLQVYGEALHGATQEI